MAIAAVQTTTTPAHTGSGGSQAASFGSLPSSGNAIVVWSWGSLTGTVASNVTCADNQAGNTYVQDTFQISSLIWFAIFRCNSIGSPSGTFTVTVTNAHGNGTMIVVGEEFSGFNSSQPDTAAVGGTGFGNTADPTSITTITDGTVVCSGESNTGNVSVTSPSSPWVSLYKETDGAGFSQGEAIYQILSPPGLLDPTWAIGGGGSRWSAVQTAFKPASAAPANIAHILTTQGLVF